MRVFVNKQFRRFSNENAISDDSLCKAVHEISIGLIHANLGGGIYKQRIARKGQGKSGGFRTIIFFKAHKTAFFILGFAKNAQDNLERNEVAGLKDLAGRMLSYDEKIIAIAVKDGALEEISCEQDVS
ncbi:type II toxin-antitoxin system RelE/ParE family toxin [Granulicella arctica]|uniref:Addiction module toxin RelE n=1 Tax=Granulicella arctica TaxID=940613 RepID=A0A7Y9PFA6_9BACT|nr:type II toxin-antitoxin system RelE/ParE family toxin [Granulicella arctica]NYF78862.1 hypothetical protein [Granulicella arctica]